MDPTIIVGIFGFFGVLATAAASVIIALITNRKESTGSAEASNEKTLRDKLDNREETIRNRDDEIRMLKDTLAYKNEELERLRADRHQLIVQFDEYRLQHVGRKEEQDEQE